MSQLSNCSIRLLNFLKHPETRSCSFNEKEKNFENVHYECSRHSRPSSSRNRGSDNPWRSSFVAERRGGRGTVFSTTSPCPFVAARGVYGFIIRARFHTLAKVSAPRPDDSVCRECSGAYTYTRDARRTATDRTRKTSLRGSPRV